jgi:hypothetical protein
MWPDSVLYADPTELTGDPSSTSQYKVLIYQKFWASTLAGSCRWVILIQLIHYFMGVRQRHNGPSFLCYRKSPNSQIVS